MASSRDDLVSEVKLILGNNDSLDARYPDWVRRAYQYIQRLIELPETQETSTVVMVVGTRAYNLPANFQSIYVARNNEANTRMMQIGIQEYDQLSTVHSGQPDRYALFDVDSSELVQFHVHPSPAATDTIQMRYRKSLPDLTSGTDQHLLPDQWDQCIIYFAASFALDSQNELERAGYYRGVASQLIRTEVRLNENLFDRNEAMSVIGGEIR